MVVWQHAGGAAGASAHSGLGFEVLPVLHSISHAIDALLALALCRVPQWGCTVKCNIAPLTLTFSLLHHTYTCYPSSLQVVAADPAAAYQLAAAADKGLLLWDLRAAAAVAAADIPAPLAHSMLMPMPGGELLLAANTDGQVCLWNCVCCVAQLAIWAVPCFVNVCQ